MNKEDVVQALMNAAYNCITDSELRDHFEQIIFGNHFDHPKVKLPREVGEYLEHWLKANSIDTIITDLVYYEGDHMVVRNWWNSTPDATYLIADMARYGWEAEPEAKWYVQTPKEWWDVPDIPEWIYLDTLCGVCSGFIKPSRTAFTRSELKQYHLDSDIFTLVPVENEEVSR